VPSMPRGARSPLPAVEWSIFPQQPVRKPVRSACTATSLFCQSSRFCHHQVQPCSFGRAAASGKHWAILVAFLLIVNEALVHFISNSCNSFISCITNSVIIQKPYFSVQLIFCLNKKNTVNCQSFRRVSYYHNCFEMKHNIEFIRTEVDYLFTQR
jgi:hypothetical protein